MRESTLTKKRYWLFCIIMAVFLLFLLLQPESLSINGSRGNSGSFLLSVLRLLFLVLDRSLRVCDKGHSCVGDREEAIPFFTFLEIKRHNCQRLLKL